MDASSLSHAADPHARSSLDALPEHDRQRALQTAVDLERAARAGIAPQQWLRGKNLAVLCEAPDCPGLALFSDAAKALGARVTHIRPSDALAGLDGTLDEIGVLLGKLYDGIDCHELAPEVVAQLERTAGKPVFQSGGCNPHRQPLTRFTLQALLLAVLT